MKNAVTPISTSTPPQMDLSRPRKAGILTRFKRVLGIVCVVYLLLCVGFYFFQSSLIFPGKASQGQPAMQARETPATRLIKLQLPDGTPIVARYDLAANADAATAPVVLLFYGNGQCAQTTGGVIYLFQQLGFNVLTPDYPGYGMSGGSPSETALFATADACWAYLQGLESRPAVHVVGWSLGTGVAIDLASRVQPATLTTIAAYTSMADMGRQIAPFMPISLILKHPFRNIDKISSVKCPILFIHGKKDSMIPWEMSQTLARTATASTVTFYPELSDHNDIFDQDLKPLLTALQKHLKPI